MLKTLSDVECCGLKRIFGFSGPITEKDILDRLVKGFNGVWGSETNNHLVILTSAQKAEYEEDLLKLGFKPIYDGLYNPNTTRLLTIYLREGVPEKCLGSGVFDGEKYKIVENENDKYIRKR